MRRHVRRALLAGLALLTLAAVAGFVWGRRELRASLPQIDGQIRLAGLSAPVIVTRDALGIPTVVGATREDVARATGFLHAQDRFFQMDLARRRAAGELSELVGARALPVDRQIRIHRLRDEARRALALLSRRDRSILDAYTAGVNAGLHSLGARPFEYHILMHAPEDWRPEDSLLVVLSMFITLQDWEGSYESTLATMYEVLPKEMADFLAPRGTEWDAPIVGERFATPPIPGREVYDLRSRRAGKPRIELPPPKPEVRSERDSRQLASLRWDLGFGIRDPGFDAERSESSIGSNAFAVSGRLTADGGALVANDMHLSVRVPNTWYRADLQWADNDGSARRLVGLTLPGVPALVTGSNTHVAWGFTNTYADWSDIVLLDVDPGDKERYRTPDGWRRFEHHDEIIRVGGGRDVHVDAVWTIWGPVLEPDFRGRPRALRWAAHSAERLALTVTPMESAQTIEQAFDAANGLGTPGQNMIVADRSGRIGWTVYGSIPQRTGIDGRLPASWADGAHGWNGWLETPRYPRVIDPPSGRLWSANAREVDGAMLDALGDGSYEIGSRATIIRDRLMARERFTAHDLLDIQLDTRALFLARWRDLAIRALTPQSTTGDAARAEFRDVLDRDWSGVAAPDSAAYRFTRMFREEVVDRVIATVLADCYEADPAFDYKSVRRRDAPIYKLATEQPMHLLGPQYASWNDLLLAAIDTVIADLHAESRGPLRERVWSEYNVTAYRHPLSPGVPLIGRWLDMPAVPLAGDLYTVNMHWRANAPSERMIVSPGREAMGVMEMPTGQSGHPLSPFYANSHEAWVNGRMTPFLPGPATHRMTLLPN
jgi:penicillin amidase